MIRLQFQRVIELVVRLVAPLLLAGCSPIVSHVAKDSASLSGMIYFLPQRDLLVQYEALTVNGGCRRTLSVGVSAVYADRSEAYVAQLPASFMGHNESQLRVSPNGLLDSAVGHSRSALTEFVLSAARSTLAFDRPIDDSETLNDIELGTPNCPEISLAWSIPIPLRSEDLGNDLAVTTTLAGERQFAYDSWNDRWAFTLEPPPDFGGGSSPQARAKNTAGLYYRSNIPYRIRIDTGFSRNSITEDLVISLPNESPTLLAPTPRSLFGAKKANLVFDAGTLTGYNVDLEGDGIQVVSLPVKVLGAVSAAAGEVFSFRRNRAQGEAAAINAELALQTQRAAQGECRSAVNSEDMDRIRKSCGR